MAVNEEGKFTKLTPETVNKLEEVFALDGTIEEACLFADISRQTYYNWIKDNKDMEERFDILRQSQFLKARRTIEKSLDNPQYAFEYMKRKKKNEFSERQEMTGADGKELIVKIDGDIANKYNINGTNGINSSTKENSTGQTQI